MPELQERQLAIVNGRVRTMDVEGTRCEAIAIQGGRIATVGSNEAVLSAIKADATVIDADSRSVLPGLIDAHSHLSLLAESLSDSVDCRTPPVHSIAEIMARGRAAARTTTPGEWIILQGSSFQQERLREGRLPTSAELDAISNDHPVLYKTNIHHLVVNRRALEITGITRETQPPPGATIHHDEKTGEPTGVLEEMFGHLGMAAHTSTSLKDALRDGAWKYYLANGVTSSQEIWHSRALLQSMSELVTARDVPLRMSCYGWIPLAGSLSEVLAPTGVELERNWFEVGGVKLFADGATSSRSAAFYEPYPGFPENFGTLNYEFDELASLIGQAEAQGAQVLVHAAGDRAQDEVLRAFELCLGNVPAWGRRHRIEHCGCTQWTEARAQWCRRLGITPVPNLGLIESYGDFWPEYLGWDRSKGCVPLRAMLDDGLLVPGNSDTSGADLILLNPFRNMGCAITRRTFRGRVIDPDQCISLDEALLMYTRYAAWAGRCENNRGSLEVGKLGDVIVLTEDLDELDADALDSVRVASTVVDGDVVYRNGERASQ
jgi:hypothetical protein